MADANINRARPHFIVAFDNVAVVNLHIRQNNPHKCIRFFKFMNFKRCLGSPNRESGIEAPVQVFNIIGHRVLQRVKRCRKINGTH